MSLHLLILACVAASVAGCSTDAPGDTPPLSQGAERGRAVSRSLSCIGCHGDALSGSPIGGWSPNLTPDQATGIGGWTDEEIAQALRLGVARGGTTLCRTMPRFSLDVLPDDAMVDLLAFLRSLPPVSAPPRGGCSRP